jgi:ABC-type molybdenum transport system ATPase subunit/photorepair protein PhrA
MKLKFNKIDTGEVDIGDLLPEKIQEIVAGEGIEVSELESTLTSSFPDIFEKYKLESKFTFSPYLSLKNNFEIPDFKDFNVITGVNGSGKTHFLKAINNDNISITIEDVQIRNSEISYFDYQSFILENEKSIEYNFFTNIQKQIISHFIQCSKNILGTYIKNFDTYTFDKIRSSWNQLNVTNKNSLIKQFDELFIIQTVTREISNANNNQKTKINYSIQEIFGDRKELYKLTKNEIGLAISVLKNQASFLTDGFSVFFRSAQEQLDNLMKEHDLKPSKAEEKYEETYQKKVPWEFLNDVFKSYSDDKFNYKYRFKEPKESLSQDLKALLVDQEATPINFEDLSSGEKILLTLSLFLYHSSINNNFPKVLLLDEIDATLHPSMCKNLVNTLKENIVAHGTKIIFATHNPSTIAFCDEQEDGIFVMSNSEKIEKEEKSKAIEILSSGLVTLDKGLTIFDEITKKDFTIISEGRNNNIIKKAIEILDRDLTEKINFHQQDNSTGISNLIELFKFLKCTNMTKKVLFVFDCDAQNKIKNLEESENILKYCFIKNTNNSIDTKGIENLFSPELFEGLYTESKSSNGDVKKTFESNKKKEFEDRILDKAEAIVFENFSSLISRIKKILNFNQ